MMRSTIAILAFLTLFACGTSSEKEQVSEEVVAEEAPKPVKGLTTLDLSAHGPFSEMMVPDKSGSGVDAQVEFDDVTGYLNIRVGKRFQMLIREEPTSLKDIRGQLSDDLMWQNEILAEDEQSLLLKKSLPDGTMEQFHFAAVLAGVGSNVVLQSDPMGEFTQADIERMLYCAKTLKGSNGLALAQ
ncbi:MAG: hypothetical protein HKN79_05490 [Flavobacteriales bacterium]|nr:hypothetical protein [Flavobacteriales bacterium]